MDSLRTNLIQRLEDSKKDAIKTKIEAEKNDSKYNYDVLIDNYDKLLYTQYVELSKEIELEQRIKEQLRSENNGRFNN